MEDKNKHIDYFELIPKYLSGNASNSEVKQLEDWVLSSEENKAQFNAFKKAWMLSAIEGNEQNIEVNQEWENISDQLFSEGRIVPLKPKQGRRLNMYLRIAAAAVILLLGSFWVFQTLIKEDFVEVATQSQIEENQLPDGSEIALNQFSSLKYTPDKKGNYRRVELQGDAFFEVKRDTARPFVVKAQNIEIKVLGTAFYVDARDDVSQIQVIVREGSVSVNASRDSVILSADEIGIYDKTTGALSKKQNEDVNYMAWKTDVLVFDETPLEQVVFDLNRKFHAKISIADEEIRDCPLETTFDHQSLEAIIKIIETTFNITAERKNDQIIFSGSACE